MNCAALNSHEWKVCGGCKETPTHSIFPPALDGDAQLNRAAVVPTLDAWAVSHFDHNYQTAFSGWRSAIKAIPWFHFRRRPLISLRLWQTAAISVVKRRISSIRRANSANMTYCWHSAFIIKFLSETAFSVIHIQTHPWRSLKRLWKSWKTAFLIIDSLE